MLSLGAELWGGSRKPVCCLLTLDLLLEQRLVFVVQIRVPFGEDMEVQLQGARDDG